MIKAPNWPGLLKSFGLTLFLVVSLCPIEQGAANQARIKLLSDEAADACIHDMDCLRALFLRATLGEAAGSGNDERLVKWTTPANIASLIGRRVPSDRRSSVDQALRQVILVADAAGVDIGLAKKESSGVVNVVMLVSNDFVRDRDDTFSEFLSTVLAGRTEIYNELSSGPSAVCQSQLFVGHTASISGALGMAESDVKSTKFKRCIHQITLKALGLRHPLSTEIDSVLNPKNKREALTSIDYVLLKLLYDPLLEPGANFDEVVRVFPQLYQKILRPSS